MRRKITAIILINLMIILNIGKNIAVTQKELQNEKESVESTITENEKKLENVKEEKSETMSEVERLIGQINNYESDIDKLEVQMSDLEKEIKEVENQIEENEKEYKKKQEGLNERLVAMYEGGEVSYLDVLLSAKSLTDFISLYYTVSELTAYDTEMLQIIEEQEKKIEEEKNELMKKKEDLAENQKAKEAKANALAIVKKEKEQKAKELSQNEANLVKEIDELKNHENEISSKILQMQKEYEEQLKKEKEEKERAAKKAEEEKKKNTNSNTSKNVNSTTSTDNGNTKSSSYGFGWPVANPVITTRYGVAGSYWSSGHHTGIDFKATKGTAVYSVGNGQVFDTGYNSAYGNFVEIYHGNNIYSFYAHASSVKVKVGQKVTKGEQIMLSGDSGNVTGPHLHFEIRSPGYKYANCVNPTKYLP